MSALTSREPQPTKRIIAARWSKEVKITLEKSHHLHWNQMGRRDPLLSAIYLVYFSWGLHLLVEVDTNALQLRLPANKLLKLKLQWLYHKVITRHDLQSLTGLLQFATKVIRPGKVSSTHYELCSPLDATPTITST